MGKKLRHYDLIIAGATSGFLTRATCQPLDVIKIRFQLQVEPISYRRTSKYHSILQATSLIAKEEGLKALWKGHVPAQLLSITYGMVQFWCFDTLMNQSKLLPLDTRYKPIVTFLCGSIAGCSATLASFPFDVVRTRLVAQGEKKRLYSGVIDAFRYILKNESILVLYRGILPTFIQVAPHAGAQFLSYRVFDNMYRAFFNIAQNTYTLPGNLVAGSLAGLVAKTLIYPFDLVKKRMQIQGVHEHRKEFGAVFSCRGMIDCCRKILRTEGPFALFKGLYPSLWKAVFTTAMHFATYEGTCKIISDFRT
ncbi:hypothetical protein PPYR_10915 [Photinus pyralis]|uniref:Mitochondrial thiamine pyrophosphate carrier n=1 Tax=Photinus pyralis TaxID=7054 RepID=A0A1Y1LM70_PHOPY|nr:mitochondrial thiamine pyrophosphate carrier [Photinus pyralis]XP_031347244.1 mitochondrial thiamine pyrophosphate carrier [Photinus pyralis]KAB0796854.1 hypothetical protein PPYR_10915 [Photinus pyralis]